MRSRFILIGLACVAGIVAAVAQSGTAQPAARVSDTENKLGFWDCNVPGGNFTIALAKISSVSVHDFNMVGGRITEVNVDGSGSVCARFYFMEPIKVGSVLAASELAKERITEVADAVADRTGTDKVWRNVQKTYPTSTHAHTVEYRLQNRTDLMAIHKSAKDAWVSNRGRTITIVEEASKK